MSMTMEEYYEYLKSLAEKKEPATMLMAPEEKRKKRRRRLIAKQFSKTKRT